MTQLLDRRDLIMVNGAGSAFSPVDLLALKDVWVPLHPVALVYMPHPYFLNDWAWRFQDQRYDWTVERKYYPERFKWDQRELQYTAWLNSQWHCALYRRIVVGALNRQIRAALDGKFPNLMEIDLYRPRKVDKKMMERVEAWRRKCLANPKLTLYRWSDPKYFRFPTRASRALEHVFDICLKNHIAVLLLEAPHHPETDRFFDDMLAAYEAELHRLANHSAVVRLVGRDAYPNIDDYFIDDIRRTSGSFLHARDAKPVLAPYFADWINQALPSS